MIAEQIRVSPFPVSQVIDCEIKKAPNEHGQAYVKGYLPPQKEDACLTLLTQGRGVQIEGIGDKGESRVIFQGRIKEGKIRRENQLLVLELYLITSTYLMDIQKRIRSFQTPGMSYQKIFDTVMEAYPGGGCILTVGQEEVTKELIVQYQETDWEFIKRLASHLQTVIIPEVQTEGVRVYAGLPQRSTGIRSETSSYRACKLIQSYLEKQQNQVEGLLEEDELCYEIEERELLELGEGVEFKGKSYLVVEARSRMDGHPLENSYLLKKAGGIRVPKQYNEKIVGASLDGRITGIQEAQVKVRLSADGVIGEERWFPFSTVYSSPDGSGWYCMPETGDEIRLYFPTIKEKHAYVISAVHLPVEEAKPQAAAEGNRSVGLSGGTAAAEGNGGGGLPGGTAAAEENKGVGLSSDTAMVRGENPGGEGAQGRAEGSGSTQGTESKPSGKTGGARSNPEEKIIRTETGKTVKLTPTRIYLTNEKGLDIILDDEEGILIFSNQKILIHSEDAVNIASGEGIELMGLKKVQLIQEESSLMLTEERVKLKGAEVRMQ